MGWPGSSIYTGACSCPEGRVTGKAFCRGRREIVSQEDERKTLVRKVVFEEYYSSEQHSTCLVLTGYIDSKLHTATVDIKNIMATGGLSFKECCRILKIPEGFQETLWVLLDQDQIIWTKELIQEYIASADLPMEKIRRIARDAWPDILESVFGKEKSTDLSCPIGRFSGA